ncbi:HD domain-containing protein [Mariniphaga sp.]|uniref:HD domain-containing protein n=1 Tax=Mariniphaga sp. TaxID=1954475 RepID=UPI0035641ECE
MEKKKEPKRIISETEKYVRQAMENDGSGHDWWHIYRVRNLALKISKLEGGDPFLIEMAALLHDLDDWKLSSDGNFSRTKKWLEALKLPKETIFLLTEIISQVSYKGAGVETIPSSLEAQIVQDADRLDAIGAIGIARTFAYGGSKGRLIFDPEIKPVKHADFEAYKKNNGPTINHFYEKLLLLKDRLNTKTAGKLAENRHSFMEKYLEEFFREWFEIGAT